MPSHPMMRTCRLSKDLDLGLRDEVDDEETLRERMIEAMSADPDSDGFTLAVSEAKELTGDGDGHRTWRLKIAAALAGRPFGAIQVDVSPRRHELDATDFVQLPNSLDFAGIATPIIEIIDVHRHAAEKLHGMLRDFGGRENTRVRDLLDLVLLCEHDLLDPQALAPVVVQVWAERDRDKPPGSLPPLPVSWPTRYERMASEHNLNAASFPAATAIVATLWAETFPTEEH